MSERERRKILLINRNFQLRHIGMYLIVNAGMLTFFGFCLYLLVGSEINANFLSAHVTYKTLQEMLLPIILILTLFTILASSLIMSLFVLYSSHKIAGPLYRFNAILEEIAGRNLRPAAQLREHDQLQEISRSMGSALETLRIDLAAVRKGAEELRQSLEPSANRDAIERLTRMEKLLSDYRL